MIINWKQEGPLSYVATWMNMRLWLQWEKPVWRVWVDGHRVKQRYDSVETAKAGVDAVVLKLISAGPVVPVEPERPRLTMQGLVSVLASIAIARSQQAVKDLQAAQYGVSKVETVLPRLRTFSSQGSRSGRVVGGAPNFTEVEHA